MKRKNLFVILAALSVMTAELSACSDKTEEKTPAAAAAAVNNYTASAEDRIVTGEVVSVVENEVTLALGNISESKREKPDFNGEKPDFGGERPEMPDGKTPPDFNGEMPDFNGEKPDFGGNFPADMEKPSGSRRRSSKTVEKTGAEESYIIPVGMTVNGLSGRNTDYKGITAGMVLTLTVNGDGVVCAASVE